MVNKKKRLIEKFLVMGILTIMLCYLVSAVAVGGMYSDDRPLEAYPGETKSIFFVLQNMAGGNDVKFRANVTEGYEIASLVDENPEYLVPLGSSDVQVRVLVEVPENAKVGSEYQVRIVFKPVLLGTEEEGMVQIALGLSRYFKVKVVEKPAEEKLEKGEKKGMWLLVLSILVIVLILAVVYFIVRSKRSTKKI